MDRREYKKYHDGNSPNYIYVLLIDSYSYCYILEAASKNLLRLLKSQLLGEKHN